MSEQVGITIKVSQAELQALVSNLKAANDSSKQSKSGLQQWAEGAVKALDKATGLHHSLRSVHFALRLVGDVFRPLADEFRKGLEFRFYDDPIKASLRSIEQSTARMRNSFVDLFIPLSEGIAGALGPLADKFTKFAKDNAKVLKTDLIGAFQSLGHTAIDVGFAVAKVAINIISGWRQIGPALDDVKASFQSWVGEQTIAATGTLAEAFQKLHLNDVADHFKELHANAKENQKDFDDAASSAQVKLAKLAAEQKEAQDLLAKAYEATGAAVDDAAEKAAKHLGDRGHTSDKTIEQTKKEQAIRDAMALAAMEYREGLEKALFERSEERAKIFLQMQEERKKQWSQTIDETILKGNLDDALALWKSFEDRKSEVDIAAQREMQKQIRTGVAEKLGEEIKTQMAEGGPLSLLEAWKTYFSARAVLGESEDRKFFEELKKATEEAGKGIGETLGNAIYDVVTHVKTLGEVVKATFDTMLRSAINFAASEAVKGILSFAVSGARSIAGALSGAGASAAASTAASAAGSVAGQAGGAATLTAAGTTLAAAGTSMSATAGSLAGAAGLLDGAATALSAATGASAGTQAGEAAGTIFPIVAAAAAEGGLVTGGRPGVDSVPALLMPGEVVVPADVVRNGWRGIAPFTAGYSGGGTQQSRNVAPPQAPEVSRPAANLHFFAPATRSDLERMYRDVILPAQARMDRLGYTRVVR